MIKWFTSTSFAAFSVSVLTENFRDESLQRDFGRFRIRLTQAFLHMSMGLAGISVSAFQSKFLELSNGKKYLQTLIVI